MKLAVCVDNNDTSRKALKEALELAEITDSELTILHSVKEKVGNEGTMVKASEDDDLVERGNRILDNYVNEVSELEYNVSINKELIISENSVVESISDYLDTNNYDHVYIGHRALDKDKEKMFGSFAKKMIRYSSIPVTVVR